MNKVAVGLDIAGAKMIAAAARIRKGALKAARRLLRSVRFGLDDQLSEQFAFYQLGRKPPDLMWQACARCPRARAEAGQAQIGERLYLIGGYETMDSVSNMVDVLDIRKRRWIDSLEMPSGTAQTHVGIATDANRFIYLAGGQLGPQCSPAVAACLVFDALDMAWKDLPPLPQPRYAPLLRLWHGRLHAISGSCPDRATPASDHWSIAVNDGQALEQCWRPEVPIPLAGTHRASAIVGDTLYVFGGHAGDLKSVPDDPSFTCDINTVVESALNETFLLEHGSSEWKTLAPMPQARGHTDHSAVQIGHCIVVLGGLKSHHEYSDLIQLYDTQTDRWKSAGRLPYGMKTNAVYHNGWLYLITGQRTHTLIDPSAGKVLNSVWRARFDPAKI